MIKTFFFGILSILSSYFFGVDDLKVQHAEAIISATNPEIAIEGNLRFTQVENGETKMVLNISVPSKANESVAVHIHEHGMCGNGGGDAHGHWNPTGSAHGKWGEGEYHSGDIGNISLNAAGKGTYVLSTEKWSINGDEKTDITGKAIIVHTGTDDYTSQPAGNAGARIGCGVITLK